MRRERAEAIAVGLALIGGFVIVIGTVVVLAVAALT